MRPASRRSAGWNRPTAASGWRWAFPAPRCGDSEAGRSGAAVEQDLAHLPRLLEQPVCLHRLGEREDAVDDRLDAVLGDQLDHGAELVVGAHGGSADVELLEEDL